MSIIINKKFHYVAGSNVLPPTAEQDIVLLRKAMMSLFPDNLNDTDLIQKNLRRVCSLSEFERMQAKLKKKASETGNASRLNYHVTLNQLWHEKAHELRLDIETSTQQEILIRAGHVFRPKFQNFIKKTARQFHCNNQKKSPKEPDGFKIRSSDKNLFRMRQKESDPMESCYKKPTKHTDILAGMIFPETNNMMERIENYFTPLNNSNTIGFKAKYRRLDDTGFGGLHLKTMLHTDIGDFKNVPFIVELQAHKKKAYKTYEQTHQLMEKQRAYDSWAQSGAETSFTAGQSHVVASFGQRLVGYGVQRSQMNKKANASLSKYQQSHEYHIVDGIPVISVTSDQGSAYDHYLAPSYREDRNDTFLVINNAYGEKISSNTKVSREQCITRLHSIAHENSSSTRLQYIPRQEPMNHHLKPKLIYSQ